MSRIVTPDGMLPQSDGPPRLPTLQERLEQAVEHWTFKRKDLGFATALNCIAFISSGLAGLNKIVMTCEADNKALREAIRIMSVGMEHLTKENNARTAEIEELKARLAQLEARQ